VIPREADPVGGLPARFTKMSGAGNDFLVFGVEARPAVGARRAETIRRLCRRGTGVGADGVLFVLARRAARGRTRVVVADYYNADGGKARFCANGTRCAARFAARALVGAGAGAELVVETGWGDVPATVRPDGGVTILLPEPVLCGAGIGTFDPGGRIEARGTVLSVGVPHVVVFTAGGAGRDAFGAFDALDSLDVAALGPPLRRHPDLPEGANVHFVSRTGDSRLAVRSFERGVEAETLSCGSGVVASAVVAALRRGAPAPIAVSTRSGSVLTVDFRVDGDFAREVTLTGDARFVFEGTLDGEAAHGRPGRKG
jgi:diaminopimelate epimerase